MLNLNTIRECTESEGPGKRFVIWTQGCLKRCPGCCNKEMQAIEKNIIVSEDDLIKIIEKAKNKYDIEGITFIGGEPILQSKGLVKIAKWAKDNLLSIMIFTGYSYDELINSKDEYILELISLSDILVDGEYKEYLYDEKRAWIGSENQKIYYLTNRYTKGLEFQIDRKIEFHIDKESIKINGWPFL